MSFLCLDLRMKEQTVKGNFQNPEKRYLRKEFLRVFNGNFDQTIKGTNAKAIALLLIVGLAGADEAHSETSAT